jgi:hypothetical protein
MNLNYKINRIIIKIKQFKAKNKYAKAVKKLNTEQLRVFNYIMNIGVTHNEYIKFDPEIDEIMIYMPDMLIVIGNYMVNIDNTHGFIPTEFQNDAYEIMQSLLKKEGHRNRRKLKHEVKIRKRNFMDKISEINIIK